MKLSDFHEGFEGWTTVQQQPNQLGMPTIPDPETRNSPSLRTAMPLPLQYTGDTIKQYNRPGLSSFRIAPLAPGGNAAVNAATASVTKIITQSVETAVDLQTNGVDNRDQQKLNLIAGSGVTLNSDSSGGVTIQASGGGSIGGTITNPHVPYASGANTLADSTWTFTPSGNIWANAQTTSEINMQSGGNQVQLILNVSGESGLLIVDSVGDSVQMDVKPGTHNALFSVFDAAGDAFEVNAQNGSGVSASLVGGVSASDNIIQEVINAKVLQQMENSLGGLVMLELNSTGTADFELSDQVGSFAELFLSGASTGHFFLIEDSSSSNLFRIDVNKTSTGNVTATLTSPAPTLNLNGATPTIFLGGSSKPSITSGAGAPTSTPASAGSIYMNSTGSLGSLLYVWTGSAWHNFV